MAELDLPAPDPAPPYPRIQRRLLDPSEAARAIAAGGPLADLAPDPEKLAQMTIAVVEVNDQIVAYWVAWYALHLEPLWINPAWRRHPVVVEGIIRQIELVVQGTGEDVAFCEVHEDELRTVGAYARRLGFAEAPGKLYYLVVQEPAAEPVEG